MHFEPKQMEMICLEDLVPNDHIYRKFQSLWNLDPIRIELEKLEADSDYKGYGIFRMFLCLLLQFVEDLRNCAKITCPSNQALQRDFISSFNFFKG